MTPPPPAEIAALRERLIEHHEKAVQAMLRHGVKFKARALADDLRAALALLDAQAAEIARLTAEREQMQNALEEYACPGRGACPAPWDGHGCTLRDNCGMIAADALSALAAAPAAEVAKC